MCTPWPILRVWPRFCATRAGAWSPKPGFKKCVPGLAPVCDRLVQDGGTHFFHSLRGWRGVVRNKHAPGPQNQDSTRIQPFAMCTPWQILRVWPWFCASRSGDKSPEPGFRKCVPGLALACDGLVQDGGTHYFHSLRG